MQGAHPDICPRADLLGPVHEGIDSFMYGAQRYVCILFLLTVVSMQLFPN